MDYMTARGKLNTARSRDAGKKIANNTRLFERPGGIAVRLHNTDIMLFRPDGSVSMTGHGSRR